MKNEIIVLFVLFFSIHCKGTELSTSLKFLQESRLKYESKHNDLIEVKYSEDWVASNPLVKVSIKDIETVLSHLTLAKTENRTNPARGVQWMTFKSRNNRFQPVSMEAWRFRGLMEVCTRSPESRAALLKKIKLAKSNSRDDNFSEGVSTNAGSDILAPVEDAFPKEKNTSADDVKRDALKHRFIYESKHNDLVQFRYRDRWVKKSKTPIVKVARKHAEAIVTNWTAAAEYARNSRVMGRKLVAFDPPQGGYGTVSMEAWRFRGLVDRCTYSSESRNSLMVKLKIDDKDGRMDDTQSRTDDLAPVDKAFEDYQIENTMDSGSYNDDALLAPVEDAFDEDPTYSGSIKNLNFNYESNNKDFFLVAVKEKFVNNHKVFHHDNYILISKNHFDAILDDCRNAQVNLRKNSGLKDWQSFRFIPKNTGYNPFEIDVWRFNAVVKSYCSDIRAKKRVQDWSSQKIILGSDNSPIFKERYLVINRETMINILENYQDATRIYELEYPSIKGKKIHDFLMFGSLEPNQFEMATLLAKDSDSRINLLSKLAQ